MPKETKEYHVMWEIEVNATSHQEAAEIARAIQQDQASEATFFSVREGTNEIIIDAEA